MALPFIERIDLAGVSLTVPEADVEEALRHGETLHRDFRPQIRGDYVDHLLQMAGEGAGMIQLVHDNDVCAIAIWRSYLTTYCGRRFEIDDLVTAERDRSRGYGATLVKALEAKARSLSCDTVTLTSATWRVDAHRFYHRERYAIGAFFFSKALG